MKRESFVFYESYLEAILKLPKDVQVDFMLMIAEYALRGEVNETDNPYLSAMFSLIKPQVDANNVRYENGKKGGAPIGNSNAKKQPKSTKNNQNQPNSTKINQIQPNVNDNDNDNVNDNENADVNVNENANENVNVGDAEIEKFQEEVRGSAIKVMNACYSLGIDRGQFVDIADKVLCEWKAVGTNDVSWRHLINAVRVHCQRNKSPVLQRMSNKAKLIEEVNKMNEITIKNGSVTKNSEQPAEPIW